VWLNEADLDRVAATGTHICHNCSSNFRLRSGVAPLNSLEKRGINTAIGLDEAGINDDRDMLQEMRIVLRAHRVPGMEEEDVPSTGQVLRMATAGGAATTPYGSHIGSLAVGKAADLVLIDRDKLAYPHLDPEVPALDAVIQRAKSDGIDLVIVAGEVVYEGGHFTRVDRDAALRELHASLNRPLADDEVERRQLSKALLPYVRRFYAGYFDAEAHQPYYRPSSRV
jgi:cytosine/adenosine deaminase-related metal-dependent hydrolase